VQPIASVIICTADRSELLSQALASLGAASPATPFETIVVDNGASSTTSEVVSSFARQSAHPIRYLHEPRRGKSHALNAGIEASLAEYLLFTDDDATVDSCWVSAMVAALDGELVGAVGGRILAAWPSPPPAWLSEGPQISNLALFDYGTEPFEMEWPRLPLGVNMGLRRSVLDHLGLKFDPRLGPTGRLGVMGEEMHLCFALGSRFRILYAPDAVVTHQIQQERIDWTRIRRRHFQVGFGLARSERIRGVTQPDLARRVVRAWRTCAGAFKTRRANAQRVAPTGEEASAEFGAYLWAGKHLEMLFGRSQRLADWIAGLPV
jgi:glycosyltransferase involved in cell wall biosynthesis